MAEISISTKDYPVVCIHFPSRIGLADMEDLGRKMDAIYSKAHAKREAVVVVVDASQLVVGGMEPQARVRLAKLGDDSLMRYPGVRIAEAVVSHSTTVRAVLKAHNLFRRNSVQQGVFSTIAEAKTWGQTLLKGAQAAKTGT